LTKVIALLALICFLVAGAAATRILWTDSVPSAGAAASVPDFKTLVVSNRQAKQDKLPIRNVALLQEADLNESLRLAYASSNDAVSATARAAMPPAPAAPEARPPEVAAAPPAEVDATPPAAPPEPPPHKVASRPQPQKSYALLSDAQIASIKGRLRLTPSQQPYWPDVEQALRALAHKIQAARKVDPNANAGSLDPDSSEVQRLKSAAMPLLLQLREDQKDEVRKLARVIGLEKVAAAI